MAVVTYRALAADIRSRTAPVTPRLIAIDGPSGAGKSTFARHLAQVLDEAPVVEMDDFVSWGDLDGWWPRFESQVLGPLLAGQKATFQRRDWENDPLGDELGPWRTIPSAPFVILEGVTSSRRTIADRLTLAVWIDAPFPSRLERGIARDGEHMSDLWRDWMQREDDFFAQDHTRDRAHIVVDGAPTASHTPLTEFLCEFPNPGIRP